MTATGTKTCSKCQAQKAFGDFYAKSRRGAYSTDSSAGVGSTCKECDKRRAADYRAKGGDAYRKKQKDSDLRRNFGIGLDEFNLMFEEQRGRCAICGIHQADIKRSLSVDHDHRSGRVRSLLCGLCNSALGKFQEDIGILENAIGYLKAHNGKGG